MVALVLDNATNFDMAPAAMAVIIDPTAMPDETIMATATMQTLWAHRQTPMASEVVQIAMVRIPSIVTMIHIIKMAEVVAIAVVIKNLKIMVATTITVDEKIVILAAKTMELAHRLRTNRCHNEIITKMRPTIRIDATLAVQRTPDAIPYRHTNRPASMHKINKST